MNLEQLKNFVKGILQGWFSNKSALDKLSDDNGVGEYNNKKITISSDTDNLLSEDETGILLKSNSLPTEHELTPAELTEIMKTLPEPPVNILRLNNKFDRSNMYSTDERIIGQWIDGKPLYQKVFNISVSVTTSSSWQDIVTITDIDTCVNAKFFWQTAYNSLAEDVYSEVGVIKANTVSAQGFAVNRTLTNALIVYTKTTDASTSIGEDTDYSITEKIVGSWIDGKPIYQKTIVSSHTGTIKSGDIVETFTDAAVNIDTLVSTNPIITGNDGATKKGSATDMLMVYTYGNDIIVKCIANFNATSNIRYTIQYTKITD